MKPEFLRDQEGKPILHTLERLKRYGWRMKTELGMPLNTVLRAIAWPLGYQDWSLLRFHSEKKENTPTYGVPILSVEYIEYVNRTVQELRERRIAEAAEGSKLRRRLEKQANDNNRLHSGRSGSQSLAVVQKNSRRAA